MYSINQSIRQYLFHILINCLLSDQRKLNLDTINQSINQPANQQSVSQSTNQSTNQQAVNQSAKSTKDKEINQSLRVADLNMNKKLSQ